MKGLIVVTLICAICGIVGYRHGFHAENQRISSGIASKSGKERSLLPLRSSQTTESDRAPSPSRHLSMQEVLAELDHAASIRDRSERERLLMGLFARLATLDRQAALERYLTLDYGIDQRSAIAGLARGLAESDPADAFDFWQSALSLVPEDDHYYSDGMFEIFNAWLTSDSSAAASAWNTLKRKDFRRSAINGLFAGRDYRDPARRDEMLALARSLSSETDSHQSFMRRHAMSLVVGGYASGESLNSMETWLEQQDFTDKERSHLDWSVAHAHLAENPHQAVTWLLARSDEKSLPSHLANIVNQWARSQPNACGEWLGNLNAGPTVDIAIARFAEIIAPDDKQSAREWALQISNPKKRDQALSALRE